MLRRILGRSAAVVSIVGASCLGIVYTAGPAQALDPGDLGKVAAGAGGGVALRAAPAVLASTMSAEAGVGAAAVCATGVGCAALGVAALVIVGGAVCYQVDECHDTVVPWITNGLGLGESGSTAPGEAPNKFGSSAWVDVPSGGAAYVDYLLDGSDNPNLTTGLTVQYECADGTTGSYDAGVYKPNEYPAPYQLTRRIWNDCVPNAERSQAGSHGGWASLDLVPVAWPCGCGAMILANGLHWESGVAITSASTTLQCRRPDGSEYGVLKTTQTPGVGLGVGHCDPGDTPFGLDVAASTDYGPEEPQYSHTWDPTPTDKVKYPLCASAACDYSVSIDGQRCLAGDPECANWELVRRTTPDRVTCMYGPYAISCDLMPWAERAWEDGPRTATQANTDGDPDTDDTEVKSPTWTPDPDPGPTASPTVTPTVIPPVDYCLNGDPACVPVSDPENPPSQSDECWPNGWGALNPANWVLQPTKCALKWAFVPPPGTLTGLRTAIDDAWDDSTGGRWFASVGDVWDTVPNEDGGGCKGPGISMGFLASGTGVPSTIYPFDACDYPVSYMAQVARSGSSFAIAFFGGLKCVQQLTSAMGLSLHLSDAYRMQAQTDRINDGLGRLG